MFDNLSQRLSETLKKLRGQGRITESNIQDTLKEIRLSFLEADVALAVIDDFLKKVLDRAVGQEVMASLDPGQVFVKIVHEELTSILGPENSPLQLNTQPPAVILMVGLQGSGKTTSVAKLARYLKERQKKKVLVTSIDIYRPAAIEQLQKLAQEVEVNFFPSTTQDDPVQLAKNAIQHAKLQFNDIVIVDTAGRLHIDETMMAEMKAVHQAIQPIETLLVVDSMTGQDAAITAKAFNEAVPLTGIILTKTDGDARGGAALSIKQITQKPIKFMGVGEKTDALEPFHPERIASRILGMGDILTLVEEVHRKADHDKAEKLAKKIQRGQGFDLNDFRDQLLQMQQMGGIGKMLSSLPMMGQIPEAVKSQVNDKETNKIVAMINSMTRKERRFPNIINGSRKKRITAGSGTQIQDLNRLVKQFEQMQKVMKKMTKGGGLKNLMRGIKGMGGFPGGFPR